MSNSELISLFQQGSSLATSDKFHIHTANGRLLTVSAETVLAYLRRSQTTFTLDENGYVIINGENTGYKIEPTDVAALTSRLASLEATTGNILDLSEPVASPTLVEAINKAATLGDGDEVYVGNSAPTDEDTDLWVDTNASETSVVDVRVNDEGHLIVTTGDVALKAKVNDQWVRASASSPVTTTVTQSPSVELLKYNQYPDGTEVAQIKIGTNIFTINIPNPTVTVDTDLDAYSNNPLANRIINSEITALKKEIANLKSRVDDIKLVSLEVNMDDGCIYQK